MKLNLKLKDVVAIGGVMTLSFPVLYVALLFLTGNARVEFGPKLDIEDQKHMQETRLLRQTARRDSLASVHSQAFEALQKERVELAAERERLVNQQERVDMLQKELEQAHQALAQRRDEMTKLIADGSELERKRIGQLAKVYSAMRPAEAAQILETLENDLVVKILMAMNDDRQKAKIVSTLTKEKASAVSRKLGNALIKD